MSIDKPIDYFFVNYHNYLSFLFAFPKLIFLKYKLTQNAIDYIKTKKREGFLCTEIQRLRGNIEVNQYEEGDLRKDITIFYEGCPKWDPEGVNKDYKSSYSNTGYNVRKFLVAKAISPDFNTSPANFVVYRYAEVLLMKAEALCEIRPGEAYASLNRVRQRAGLENISGLSQDELREAIIHERRIELAFEGHRWFDMIRINDGEYALQFLRSIGKTNVTKERLLFPIPQVERDANPLMGQNPGY